LAGRGFKAQGARNAHPQKSSDAVAVIGVDIGKNTFHLVGLDKRGAIVLGSRYVSRSQLERRLVDVAPGLEAGQRFAALGHDVRRRSRSRMLMISHAFRVTI
jgi:transposase